MILILEQSKQTLDELKDKIAELGVSLDIEALKTKIDSLEATVQGAGFWDDPQASQKTLVELKAEKDRYENYINLKTLYEDTCELLELAADEDDDSMADDILADIRTIKKSYEDQKTQILLSGEYDRNNAIIAIHPGAGGTEAQDWAQMLYRMYSRWAEKRGFKVKVLDYLDGDEAGIKSVTFLIEGLYAYGYAKSESGVHRLVRVSPFDASGRRQTSFASVEVAPEFNDEIKIEIKEEEIKVEAHRASGAGGQHVNKTDSAIRITHLPTGIVVGCQNERSQVQNREVAMKMLKSKLLEIKEREHLEKIEDIKGVKNNIEWGSQIRSYVFMPYTLAKDHRTNYEDGDINSVMDGDLDEFMNAYLKYKVQA